MKKISLMLFDLDGTLINSKKDIADSVNYTMRHLGLKEIDHETIYEFVGNGVMPLIQKSLDAAGGVSFDQALSIFKKHYMEHLLDTTHVFDGVFEVLTHFKNIPKIIITNKSQNFSEKIVPGLKLEAHVEGLYGGDTQFPKKPDPTLVHHLVKTYKVPYEETVIIGDSRVDLDTGHNAGILTCAAAYGFRPREELLQCGSTALIEKPIELIEIFSPSS